MIPGMLIRVNPYKYMTAYCNLWTQEEYHRVIQAGIIKQNMISLEPGMNVWCNILYNDKIGWVNTGEANYKVITENGG